MHPHHSWQPLRNVSGISQELSALYGGFWDVFVMGDSFSYAIYCIDYVELAGDYWTVLICKVGEALAGGKHVLSSVECGSGKDCEGVTRC